MKKALLMLLAFVGLPMVWVLTKSLLEAVVIDSIYDSFFTPGRICYLSGMVAMIVLYAWRGQALQITYVFAHEMTHAVVGLLCFAKVHTVKVSATGGFVQLSKSNLLITLSPYCVPFYLLITVLIYGMVQYFSPNIFPFGVWAFLFGVMTAFHVWYTANALIAVSQPDTHVYGRFFSWWFILVMNLFFAILAVVITSENVTARAQTQRIAMRTIRVYRSVYSEAHSLINRVCVNDAMTERGVE